MKFHKKSPGFYLLLFIITILFLNIGYPQQSNSNMQDPRFSVKLNPDAPTETEMFGQFKGIWQADQSVLNSDGTWYNIKNPAIWKWYYILDGHAIQDDWITVDSLNRENTVGTNIRIFNDQEKKWYIAWIDKTNRKLATFTATSDSGKIFMEGTNAKGRQVKTTFYNISENDFDWKQEWTFDNGASWVEVTKIHCKRKI